MKFDFEKADLSIGDHNLVVMDPLEIKGSPLLEDKEIVESVNEGSGSEGVPMLMLDDDHASVLKVEVSKSIMGFTLETTIDATGVEVTSTVVSNSNDDKGHGFDGTHGGGKSVGSLVKDIFVGGIDDVAWGGPTGYVSKGINNEVLNLKGQIAAIKDGLKHGKYGNPARAMTKMANKTKLVGALAKFGKFATPLTFAFGVAVDAVIDKSLSPHHSWERSFGTALLAGGAAFGAFTTLGVVPGIVAGIGASCLVGAIWDATSGKE